MHTGHFITHKKVTIFHGRPFPEKGMLAGYGLMLQNSNCDPALTAAIIAFGFVFILPLYECVEETINRIISEEIDYLEKYDREILC